MMSYQAAHVHRVADAYVSGKVASPAKALEKVKKAFDGVPHGSIAIVLSAQASLEDNWALVELGKLMGIADQFVASAPDGDHDDILISRRTRTRTTPGRQVAGPQREDVGRVPLRGRSGHGASRHRARRGDRRSRDGEGEARQARGPRHHRLARVVAHVGRHRRPPRDVVGRAERYVRQQTRPEADLGQGDPTRRAPPVRPSCTCTTSPRRSASSPRGPS